MSILLIGLTGLAFAFVIMWRYWPDPDAARPGDIKESDLLPLTKRDTPSHVRDDWRIDLPTMKESIDRAIALAASLPDEYTATRVYLTESGAEVARAL